MRYPTNHCSECGHRLFSHVDDGTFCPDCGYYFEADDEGGAVDEPTEPVAHT